MEKLLLQKKAILQRLKYVSFEYGLPLTDCAPFTAKIQRRTHPIKGCHALGKQRHRPEMTALGIEEQGLDEKSCEWPRSMGLRAREGCV